MKRNESNKHKNYLINENMNAMSQNNKSSDKRNVLSAKKTNEFAGSIRYV